MGSVACEPGDVLYIDLENGERRIRSRLDTFFARGKPPRLPRLEWLNEMPPDKNFVGILEDWRLAVSEPRLVVIDASHPLQPPPGAGHDGLDSAALSELRRWASGHPLAVVCLLRTRKAPVMDPHEAAANALFACADAVLLLDREMVERPSTCAAVTSRKADGAGLRQELLVLARRGRRYQPVGRAHENPRRAAGSRPGMYPREIAEVLDVPSGNVRRLLFSMVRDGEVITSGLGRYRVAE